MTKKAYYAGTAILCGALLIVSLLFSGTLVSVYTGVIADDLGMSRAAFSSFNLCRALVGFFLGLQFVKILRRLRLRFILLCGCTMVTAMLLLLTFCSNLPMLWAVALLGGIGTTLCGVIPITLVVRNWYMKSYGTVIALVMSASGIGGAAITPILSRFINAFGWRTGFRALAVASLMVLVLALLFLKEEPCQVGMTAYGAEDGDVKSTEHEQGECHLHLLGSSPVERDMRSMMLMHGMFAISALCVYTNLPSVVSEIGFSTVFATGTAVSVASLFNCLGKVVMGKVNDRFGVPCMTCLWYGVCPLAMLFFALIRVQIVPVALIGIVLIGISAGIYSVPIPIIAGCLFHKDGDYARVISLCSASSSLCTSISSMIYHGFYDVSGTYRGALLFAAVLSVASLAIALQLLHRNRNAFCRVN